MNNKNYKNQKVESAERPKRLCILSSAAFVAAWLVSPANQAQDSAELNSLILEDIVVTAQKREQLLRDVPMAVSAFGGEDLESRVIDDALDLQYEVPNLLFNGAVSTLRGIGNNAISTSSEAGLGNHINGVYINAPASLAQEYFDLERIEVLRGPQGTLYGRNTTGGVINLISAAPQADYAAELSATIGNYGHQKINAMVNLPLSDNIKQRFSGYYTSRDGYIENVFTGSDIDGRDSFAVRSSTLFEFGEDTDAQLVVSYFEEDSTRSQFAKATCTKDINFGCSPAAPSIESFGTPDSRSSLFQNLPASPLLYANAAADVYANASNPADFRTVNYDINPQFLQDETFASLEINRLIGDWRLTSVTGYQEVSSKVLEDFDKVSTDALLNFPITYRPDGVNVATSNRIQTARRDDFAAEQFSQELRMASQFDGPINYLFGAYYFDYESSIAVDFTHPSIAFTQQIAGFSDLFEAVSIDTNPSKTQSWAVFGEGYFALNPASNLTLGLRYSNDDKSSQSRQLLLNPQADGSPPPFAVSERDWGVGTGRIALDHALSEDLKMYGSISRGYKAGGLNPGGPAGGTAFEPEYLNALELGFKGAFVDGRMQANFTAFYYDYTDIQLAQANSTSVITVNGDAEVYGAEMDLSLVTENGWLFDLNLALLNSEITNFESADESDPLAVAPGSVVALDSAGNVRRNPAGLIIQDLRGNQLPNSPESSIKLGVQKVMAFSGDLNLVARLDHFWQDDFTSSIYNKPVSDINSWGQTNFQLRLAPNDDSWFVNLYIKNLSDNDDIVRIQQEGPLVGRFRSVAVLEPRTYAIEFGKRFD